jgi:ferric-dicitrate binding protein FerR (iron transport regulator)
MAGSTEGIVAALEERNRLIVEQTRATQELRDEVVGLRSELGSRPTRVEVDRQRRRAIGTLAAVIGVAILVAVYLAMWFHEVYRDQCEFNPAEQGVNAPGWCDHIFPGQAGHRVTVTGGTRVH